MWKPLSIVSGVALLAAGGIEYVMVRPQLIAEKTQLANAGGNKKTAEKSRTAMEAAVKTSEADLAKVKDAPEIPLPPHAKKKPRRKPPPKRMRSPNWWRKPLLPRKPLRKISPKWSKK